MRFFYLIITGLSHVLPIPVARFVTRRIADFCYYTVYRKGRDAWISNIKLVFPEKCEREIKKLAREGFRNFAEFIYEFLLLPKINKRNLHKFMTPHGFEKVKKFMEEGKGVIIQTMHLGNWEWGAAFLSLSGCRLTVIALPYRSPWFVEYYRKRRETAGMRVVFLREAARESIRVLRKGEMLALLGDRDFTGTGKEAEFFGKKVKIPIGGIELARKLGSVLVPAFNVKERDGRYHVYFEPPLDVSRPDALEEWVRIMERYVRKYPAQWYLFEPL
ncbi:hypothetical protein DRQ16_03995 [bacterium]|nr:MAG: hypothetical protein DRQ16_03995 [bacterium]